MQPTNRNPPANPPFTTRPENHGGLLGNQPIAIIYSANENQDTENPAPFVDAGPLSWEGGLAVEYQGPVAGHVVPVRDPCGLVEPLTVETLVVCGELMR